jgi:hypothetical protein
MEELMLKKNVAASILVLGFLATPVTSTSAYASPQIFENMSGSWRGKGLVKSGPKAKKESIRCKLKGKPDGASKLKMVGNCAVSGFIFSLNGYIQQNGGKNSYSASMFRSLANLKQSNFSGKRSGTKINFSFKAVDRLSKTDIVARINLNSRSAKAFVVDISRTDPKSGKVFKVGTINFAKRK